MEDRITFTESEKLHSKIIDVLENFLTSSNVSYKIIKKDAFSNSAWGPEDKTGLLFLGLSGLRQAVDPFSLPVPVIRFP
jgi:hypothetical protein